jgi:peptide deformylase
LPVLPIRQFGDPALRQRARPVERVTEVHRALVSNMIETMRSAPGVGLAAPQVGVLERIFTFEVDDVVGALVNPVMEERSEETVEAEEGCLSLPGLLYPVARAAAVRVSGLDEHGRPVTIEGRDLLARVFQHEIDHLDGVLLVDRLPEELRREALAELRARVLGIPSPTAPRPAGEAL